MHSKLALNDWVIMAMESADKNSMEQSTLQQHCDMRQSRDRHDYSQSFEIIMVSLLVATHKNYLMMTYFYLGYDINGVIPTGKKPQ